MKTIEYITLPGDRWDLIAYKAYGTIDTVVLADGGTANAIALIMRANPTVAGDSILPESLLINVPVIPDTSVQSDKDLLPPWKQ